VTTRILCGSTLCLVVFCPVFPVIEAVYYTCFKSHEMDNLLPDWPMLIEMPMQR
jgi:hypothetical protein